MPEELLQALTPQSVTPAMLVLACDDAPQRTILCAGAGSFEAAHVTLTQGLWIGAGDDTPERLAQRLDAVRYRQAEMVPASGSDQRHNEMSMALAAASRG